MSQYTNYLAFTREQWAALRNKTPLLLLEEELESIKGFNDKISLQEVEEIYLPLIRLIKMRIHASAHLQEMTDSFLNHTSSKKPYIIGLAGSVAAGKSTIARVLQTLLSRGEDHPKVQVVTTDGFLYAKETLEQKQLMSRKGFPESYDSKKLINFMRQVKSGEGSAEAPIYSHLTYDILPDQVDIIDQPDIVIVEGINVLQVDKSRHVFVSDFFDFSIFLDAEEHDLKRWYIDRFLLLQQTAFQNPLSHFHRYITLTQEEAIQKAAELWDTINAVNLKENILPTKRRANLILKKGEAHKIEKVLYKKF
ncbi:pantothenate kinase [Paenibacillus cellulosilyticus]|uniref:Pantothenate kinase n=1 Tax=Paenibacillus cellulosilyticus TaxID=375489 RepID=A0A2V2Z2J4_9BACL|nr:type I pantothenate kinase [Paenibacillus cellulosilyticus]PWW02871.1 pantothenate kinase [Paenibacillus cellulosilyticus]QKS45785.1 type I pantothenate kinase [Paenibacillus cellulosilyticus]